MAGFENVSPQSILVGAAVISLVYTICLSLHRLYLSPIAEFPGPKLAAASLWYEFYHDVIRGGQYTYKIEQMHDIYGRLPLRFPARWD
jgi:hypothetical protein